MTMFIHFFLLGRPSQNVAVLSQKGGSQSQAFHAWTAETGDESAKACVCVIRKDHAVLCEDRFAKTDAL